MKKDFEALNISNELISALKKQSITEPTQIQRLAIPKIFENKDLYATSQTGTGKTLAYLLPMLMKTDPSIRSAQVIILSPTHELCAQIFKQSQILLANAQSPLKSILIIGGANMQRQLEGLKEKPQIIVGSAGRVLELIQKKKIHAHTVKTIILDEADRMLDDINITTIQSIIKTTLKERQILLFSATNTKETLNKSEIITKDVELISAATENSMPETIEHFYIECAQRDKINTVRKLLQIFIKNNSKTLIFVQKKDDIQTIEQKFKFHNLPVDSIYGTDLKNDRRLALQNFRTGTTKALLSSDISARGLDIQDVNWVVNFSLPEDPIQYLHRAGRTGRNGKKGTCVSVVTKGEIKYLDIFEKEFDIRILPKKLFSGAIADINEIKK